MKLRLLTSFMISASVLVLLLFCLKVLWAVTDLREPPDSRQLTVAKELKKTTKEQQPQDRVLKIKPCSYPADLYAKRLTELSSSDLTCFLAAQGFPQAVLSVVQLGKFAGSHFSKATFFEDMFATAAQTQLPSKHFLTLSKALPQLQNLQSCLVASNTTTLRSCSNESQRDVQHPPIAPKQVVPAVFSALSGMKHHLASNAHAWAEGKLIEPRRNGICFVTNRSGHEEMISIGGRYAFTVESWNLVTGEQRVVSANDTATRNLVDQNHIHGVLVAPTPAPNSEGSQAPHEFWIACGFRGKELGVENMTIISLVDWSVREGPALLEPRGGCNSFALDRPLSWMQPAQANKNGSIPLDRKTRFRGRLVCAVGGIENHDLVSTLKASCSCYDRLTQQWLKLPDLREPLHHHSSVLLPRGVCNPTDPPRLLMWSGRNGDGYGPTTNTIFELRLYDGEVQHAPDWIYHDGAPTLTSAAAQALTRDGRYAFLVGGNGHTIENRQVYYSSATVVYDICRHRFCRATQSPLRFVKWAITGCTTLEDRELLICGGDSTQDPDYTKDGNTRSCDIFSLDRLVQECDNARDVEGGGWQNISRFSAKEILRRTITADMPLITRFFNRTNVMRILDKEVH